MIEVDYEFILIKSVFELKDDDFILLKVDAPINRFQDKDNQNKLKDKFYKVKIIERSWIKNLLTIRNYKKFFYANKYLLLEKTYKTVK